MCLSFLRGLETRMEKSKKGRQSLATSRARSKSERWFSLGFWGTFSEEDWRSLWLTCFWVHFPILLLLPHSRNLDLDMLLLQTSCSDGTGTKWGPANVLDLLTADIHVGFLGQRSKISFWLQSSEVLESWHCENWFFPPHRSPVHPANVKWLWMTHSLETYFFCLGSLKLGR